MAIGAFGRNRNEESELEVAVASVPVQARSSQIVSALIDQGSRCEGKLFFRDAVRIDGSFSGEISSENTLIVGETGEIDAEIRSARVIVSGTVVGNVQASAQIVLHKSARVEGNLSTPSLLVETGAVLKGHIDMGPTAKNETPEIRKAVAAVTQKAQPNASNTQAGPAKAQSTPAKRSGNSRESNKVVAN